MGTTYLLYSYIYLCDLIFPWKQCRILPPNVPVRPNGERKKKDYRIKLKQFLAPFIISQIQSQDPLFYKNRSGVSGTWIFLNRDFYFILGRGGVGQVIGYYPSTCYYLLNRMIILILNSICIILYIMISIRISGPKGQCSLIR